MARLPENFEKDFLDLLADYSSEESKRTRRNLIVSSFIVSGVYFLGLSLTDLKVFGLNLQQGDETKILILAIGLILYWLVMLLMYFFQDNQVQKERKHLLDKHVTLVKNRIDQFQKKIDEQTVSGGYNEAELSTAKSSYAIYERQQKRTRGARIFKSFTKKIEVLLPLFLGLCALFFLSADLSSTQNEDHNKPPNQSLKRTG